MKKRLPLMFLVSSFSSTKTEFVGENEALKVEGESFGKQRVATTKGLLELAVL